MEPKAAYPPEVMRILFDRASEIEEPLRELLALFEDGECTKARVLEVVGMGIVWGEAYMRDQIPNAVSRPYWISWYDAGPSRFTLDVPWWISAQTADGTSIFCAAVWAANEQAAKDLIFNAYDTPPFTIQWRFCHRKEPSWSPFSERFPRAEWMRWP